MSGKGRLDVSNFIHFYTLIYLTSSYGRNILGKQIENNSLPVTIIYIQIHKRIEFLFNRLNRT
jgi:hypothetical protein